MDTEAPTAVIGGAPSGVTNETSATLTVSGADVVSYRHRVNGGGWSADAAVGAPLTLSGLDDGPVTVEVLGADAVGNWQQAPTAATWTVDTEAPTAVILGAPEGTVIETGATLHVVGDDVSAYRFRRDGGAWSEPLDVQAPIVLKDLPDGQIVVEVVGADDVGNWQITPTAATWTVAFPLVAVIEGVPPERTNDTTATLWVSGERIVSYAFELSGSGWSDPLPVDAPILLEDLEDGAYVLRVIGGTAEGRFQEVADATMAGWTVYTQAPHATLAGVPQPWTPDDHATIQVGGEEVVGFRYRLDGGDWSQTHAVAEPITLKALPEGLVAVSVVAVDDLGNWQREEDATEAVWTVDWTPPVAQLSGSPTSPTVETHLLVEVSTATGVVGYRYRLDDAPWSENFDVSTPIVATDLADGPHTLWVVGVDLAGNWQATEDATEATWEVDAAPPSGPPVVSGVPDAVTNQTGATLTVSGDRIAAYRWQMYGAWSSWRDVAEPVVLEGLSDGQIEVVFQGRTALEVAHPTDTVVGWVIDTSPPKVITLSGVPKEVTNVNHAEIGIGPEDIAWYRYALDDLPFSDPIPNAGPLVLKDLADGSHDLRVYGANHLGTWMRPEDAAKAKWAVDTQPPTAVLFGVPDHETTATDLAVEVGGVDVVAYRYRLDGGAWSNDLGVHELIKANELTYGDHLVEVVAADAVGNWQTLPTAHGWRIVDPVVAYTITPTSPGVIKSDHARIDVWFDRSMRAEGMWIYGDLAASATPVWESPDHLVLYLDGQLPTGLELTLEVGVMPQHGDEAIVTSLWDVFAPMDVVHVDAGAICERTCDGTVAAPYFDLADGLAAAGDGGAVWVAGGLYTANNLPVPVGVSLYGGFAWTFDEHDPEAFPTEVVGSTTESVLGLPAHTLRCPDWVRADGVIAHLEVVSPDGGTAVAALTVDSGCTAHLRDLSLVARDTAGSAQGTGSYGLYAPAAASTVKPSRKRWTRLHATSMGVRAYSTAGANINGRENVEIVGGTYVGGGGSYSYGIRLHLGYESEITYARVDPGRGNVNGRGIQVNGGGARIHGNVVRGGNENTTPAIGLWLSGPEHFEVTSNAVDVRHVPGAFSVAMLVPNGQAFNASVRSNTLRGRGIAVYFYGPPHEDTVFSNNIIVATSYAFYAPYDFAFSNLSFNLVQALRMVYDAACGPDACTIAEFEALGSGVGNVAGDPMLADPANADYRLTSASPCFAKAGGASAWGEGIDATGKPRTRAAGCVLDDTPGWSLGAYEYDD